MKYPAFMFFFALSAFHFSCAQSNMQPRVNQTQLQAGDTASGIKSNEEWRKTLTPEQYYVTCEGGTEQAFTGKYWNFHGDGTYHCVRCGEPLFDSNTKFDSGTGWPSFTSPVAPEKLGEKEDLSYGMLRTEVVCKKCGAHLGHVFPDGPAPKRLRYCVNSISLDFKEREK